MEEAPIYLDYNGTTPLDPAVSAAMLPYLQVLSQPLRGGTRYFCGIFASHAGTCSLCRGSAPQMKQHRQ